MNSYNMNSYNKFLPNYSVGIDAYKKIEYICSEYGKNIIVIGGKTAIEKAKSELEAAVSNTSLKILGFIWYGGDATFENVGMLKENPLVQKADMIFAVGGGRVVDTCKVVSDQLRKSLFTFPTIASNCAPCTKISVIYDENGGFKQFYLSQKIASHIFISTKIITEAPEAFLWAGIGDALSKEYEAAFSSRNDKLEHFDSLGIHISKLCTTQFIEKGKQALLDCKSNTLTKDLEEIILDIIVSTALVSNLVNYEYDTSIAHSIYNGMTQIKKIKEKHLHGEIVAYGLQVLLLCDKQLSELDKVHKFCKSIGLPTKLTDLDVKSEDLSLIITNCVKSRDLVHSPYKITYEMIQNSIHELENYD